jgi:hypothetical protein
MRSSFVDASTSNEPKYMLKLWTYIKFLIFFAIYTQNRRLNREKMIRVSDLCDDFKLSTNYD